MKNMLSMFTFYKYLFTKDERKYEIAMDSRGVIAVMTPLIVFIVSMIAFTYIGSISVIIPMATLFGTFINFMIIILTKHRGYEILLEREEEARRLAEEEKVRRWNEFIKQKEQEAIRQARQQARRQREEFERLNREREERLNRERERKSSGNQYSYRYNEAPQQDRNMNNAIKLLGLEKEFTKKDVKQAYRNLSKIHHPDCGGTEENFKRLNKAYNYLMDRI